MLLQVLDETQGGPGARPVGILDSPTLARVERAMLRHGGADREGQDVARAQYTQSLLSAYGKDSATATAPVHVIKRGLLWQQRDRLFSRWKERYFVLTRDYLHCFRRASGSDRISEMGQFLFKVKLVDVARVEWENKKTYSTVALVLGRDGKIYLRSADGLEDWFELLEECTVSSKERRRALRYSHNDGGKPTANNNVSSSLDEWMAARQKIQMGRLITESVSTRPEVVRRRIRTPIEEDWEPPNFDNRLSLLTDIDLADCDSSACSTLGAASSVTSYRHSDDVFCIQPPSLRAMASFRSAAPSTNSTTPAPEPQGRRQYFKFRERSYSDIQRV